MRSRFKRIGAESGGQDAAIEDLDTKAVRSLDKTLFAKLAAGDWIARRENLIIVGKTEPAS